MDVMGRGRSHGIEITSHRNFSKAKAQTHLSMERPMPSLKNGEHTIMGSSERKLGG
jgi:hypothetical protein